MKVKVTGTVEELNPVKYSKDGQEKTINKFILEEGTDEYPNPLEITSFLEDELPKVGDTVEVTGFLNGRKWTSPKGEKKCFMSINAKEINITSGQEAAPADITEEDLPF
jgi:hypothetical protein